MIPAVICKRIIGGGGNPVRWVSRINGLDTGAGLGRGVFAPNGKIYFFQPQGLSPILDRLLVVNAAADAIDFQGTIAISGYDNTQATFGWGGPMSGGAAPVFGGNSVAVALNQNLSGSTQQDAVIGLFDTSTGTFSGLKSQGTTTSEPYCQIASNNASGGLIAMSSSYYGGSSANIQHTITAYNSTLTKQWTRRLDTGSKVANSAQWVGVDSSNNVYSIGIHTTTGTGTTGFGVFKYNSAGTLQWQKAYTGNATPGYLYAIHLDPATGNIYGAAKYGTGAPNYGRVGKINGSDGTQAWAFDYGINGTLMRGTQDVYLSSDGYLYAGFSGDYNSLYTPAYILRINPANGTVLNQWMIRTATGNYYSQGGAVADIGTPEFIGDISGDPVFHMSNPDSRSFGVICKLNFNGDPVSSFSAADMFWEITAQTLPSATPFSDAYVLTTVTTSTTAITETARTGSITPTSVTVAKTTL